MGGVGVGRVLVRGLALGVLVFVWGNYIRVGTGGNFYLNSYPTIVAFRKSSSLISISAVTGVARLA